MVALSHVSLSLLLLILALHDVGAKVRPPRRRPEKLFVFGDSYADTGNIAKLISPSWHEPYGITFPGHPDGRFSDGRIFSDYVASFLKLKSPVAYELRSPDKKKFPDGMNFAVGGSGVFDTMFFQQNLTVQINHLQELIAHGVFSKADLLSSVATISISGNDYSSFQSIGGNLEGLKKFAPTVIDQLKVDLKRVHDLGVAKVAVGNLHPIGCTPSATAAVSHKHCNTDINNIIVPLHNKLLVEAVKDLNKNASGSSSSSSSPFTIINLNRAFNKVLTKETKRFPSILEPCCAALSGRGCGDEDFNGTKLYKVCSKRDSYFYWDNVHLTQAGWSAVFAALGRSLQQLFI